MGMLYQFCVVLLSLVKGLCCNGEVREEELLSDFDSPTKSPYQSLASTSFHNTSMTFEPPSKGFAATLDSPMLVGQSINAEEGHFGVCDPIIKLRLTQCEEEAEEPEYADTGL